MSVGTRNGNEHLTSCLRVKTMDKTRVHCAKWVGDRRPLLCRSKREEHKSLSVKASHGPQKFVLVERLGGKSSVETRNDGRGQPKVRENKGPKKAKWSRGGKRSQTFSMKQGYSQADLKDGPLTLRRCRSSDDAIKGSESISGQGATSIVACARKRSRKRHRTSPLRATRSLPKRSWRGLLRKESNQRGSWQERTWRVLAIRSNRIMLCAWC